MTLVDLSHPMRTGMPVYPGDPEVEFTPVHFVHPDGVAVQRITFSSHSGTHLDAPSHSIVGGRTVDQVPLELLWGPAWVLRAPDAAGHSISIADVEIPETLPSIVCVATGWDRHYASADVTAHPFVSLELAELLWARGARVLGVDMMSPDPSASPNETLPVHEFWLGNDGVIIENLTGLDKIPDEVEMSLMPISLAGVDGGPVRAVARVS